MPNYAALRQGILNDLNRPDLDDVASDYLEGVIRFLQKSFFYATDQTNTMATVVGQTQYELPSDPVSINYLQLDQAGVWRWLSKVDYEMILRYDSMVVPTLTVPSLWAPFGTGFRIYNAPDQIYTMRITGNGRIPIPAADNESNFWTNEAASYVRYLTVSRVHRLRIKNYEAAMANEQLAELERIALMRESINRATDRSIAPHE